MKSLTLPAEESPPDGDVLTPGGVLKEDEEEGRGVPERDWCLILSSEGLPLSDGAFTPGGVLEEDEGVSDGDILKFYQLRN